MSWLYVPKPNPNAKVKIFCFHFAGGSAQTFRSIGMKVDSNIEINAIQLPGHAERIKEPPFRRMPDLIDGLVPGIKDKLDRPYFLLGQSLGGIIAFEVARRLRELGHLAPQALILASRPAPQQTEQTISYNLSDADFLNVMESRYGALPGREILEDPDLRKLLLPVLKTDMEIHETYSYRVCEPFEFPIIAFKGADDQKLSDESVMAWKALTTTSFKIVHLPGGHFFWQANEANFISEVQGLLSLSSF